MLGRRPNAPTRESAFAVAARDGETPGKAEQSEGAVCSWGITASYSLSSSILAKKKKKKEERRRSVGCLKS